VVRRQLVAVLKGRRPASSVWSAGGGYELRGKSGDAIFTQPKLPPQACRSNQVVNP
jgi:hypothetical protein